ncbi:Os05g0359000 [Oryza sativa Japonica Group]|uniref:Os05g0359000 protein n=1 Tax=Oryza sativa subsp. japonica TaxID=39947 RepID=Q6L477_ORYSJ|nr:unknown protein [Oryza sativa Japonica Group]BAH93112.1 Os05g0359000 [Oryza sativa Japonica Group]|eukprot:NP_001174384.1 Os05g0359000 [Oryza sativa Japonica Group]
MRTTAPSSKAATFLPLSASAPTSPPPRRRLRPPRSPPRRVDDVDPLPNHRDDASLSSSAAGGGGMRVAASSSKASATTTTLPTGSGPPRRLQAVSRDEQDSLPTSSPQPDVRDSQPALSPQPDEPRPEKRKRGGRGRNKMPKGRYTITHVTDDGQPMLPKTAVSAFRRACSVIGRSKIKITYKDWKKVPNTEKTVLWETMKGMFEIPESAHDSVQRQALLKIGKVWKNFKSELYKKYVKQDRTPFHDKELAHLRDQWNEFVQRCQTPEFLHQSEVNKALSACNTHPHRLGTGGYVGKSFQWAREDEEAAQLSRPTPFADIPVQRARNWVRARAITTSDGSISFANTETEQVAQRVQQLAEESLQGSFQSCREKDILTEALGTKEHPGRTRGLGATVPWKAGFTDNSDLYKKHRRSKGECEETNVAQLKKEIYDELAAKIDSEVEERLQQALNQRSVASPVEPSPNTIQDSVVSPVPVEPSPNTNQGNCGAVAHSHPGGSIIHDRYPVDDIEEHTKCKIQVAIGVGTNFIIDAGEGTAYPCSEDPWVQGVPLAEGYGKVRVNMVYPNFTAFPLPLPPNEEIMTLGQALRKCIQWPKKDITLST